MRFPSPQRPIVTRLALAALVGIASSGAYAQTSTDPTTPATPTAPVADAYGSYLRPYAADSLWNSRPVRPVLGTFSVPKSTYFPSIASGTYSTGVFLADSADTPMVVYGPATTATVTTGVSDPDSGYTRLITIPRWPANVLPATGADGHADIVDPVTKTIHSFWKLKQINGKWTAALYSWSKLDGKGWSDPAHYYQGARAVGIPASAGLIRKHEINDGDTIYRHALAMSLTFNALGNGVTAPSYVFPATSADGSLTTNTGSIPEGALLMLPPSFDINTITNPKLRKIAQTLQVYGAYVVDRNVGTPFAIYVENGADFNLMPNGWDNAVAGQLDLIRAGLRQALSAGDWIDASGKSIAAAISEQKNLNILSMRGPWYKQSGTALATYNTTKQQLEFDPATAKAVHVNANNTGMTKVMWAVPAAGTTLKFSSSATGGATVRLQVKYNGVFVFDSGALADGQSARFKWPGPSSVILIAGSGTAGPSTAKAELVAVPEVLPE